MNAEERERFRNALIRSGMSSGQLGIVSLADDSWNIVIGYIATSVVYQRVSYLAPASDLLPLAIIVVSVSACILWVVGEALESQAFRAMWRESEDWSMMMIQCGSVVRTTCFFVCSHFMFGLVTQYMEENFFSLLDCLLIVPVLVLILQFAIRSSSPDIRQK